MEFIINIKIISSVKSNDYKGKRGVLYWHIVCIAVIV